MKLPDFLHLFFREGRILVEPELPEITAEEKEAALEILRAQFEQTALDLPKGIPAFEQETAFWAARYIYFATHLVFLRDIGVDKIEQILQPYSGPQTPAALLSADLTLSALPALLRLSRGFAPDDVLVKKLTQTANFWFFSGIGIRAETLPDFTALLNNKALMDIYADRLIQARDRTYSKHPDIAPVIEAISGDYKNILKT